MQPNNWRDPKGNRTIINSQCTSKCGFRKGFSNVAAQVLALALVQLGMVLVTLISIVAGGRFRDTFAECL